METIFTTMDCGVITHSLDGTRLLGINQAALDILGYDSAEDLMAAGFDMVAPSDVYKRQPSPYALAWCT